MNSRILVAVAAWIISVGPVAAGKYHIEREEGQPIAFIQSDSHRAAGIGITCTSSTKRHFAGEVFLLIDPEKGLDSTLSDMNTLKSGEKFTLCFDTACHKTSWYINELLAAPGADYKLKKKSAPQNITVTKSGSLRGVFTKIDVEAILKQLCPRH